jgi:hypothetical protein
VKQGERKRAGAVREKRRPIAAVTEEVKRGENAEKERIRGHEHALGAVRDLPLTAGATSREIVDRINRAEHMVARRDWQEFQQRACGSLIELLEGLNANLRKVQQREKEAAEVARAKMAPQAATLISPLVVPDWLESKWPAIAALAQRLHAMAMNYDAAADLSTWAEAVRRLATDARMRKVWRELLKRQRGDFVHPANERRVRLHPHREAIEGLSSQQPSERDRLQEEACMLLFSVAAGAAGLNRPGLSVRTRREVMAEVIALRRLAQSLDECERLGCVVTSLSGTFIREQADRRESRLDLQVSPLRANSSRLLR